MKLVAARPTLAQAVKVASAAAGGSLPICNGVRFDVDGPEVTVTCTNLDLTIRATVAITGGEPGSVVVPVTFINRFLSGADGGTVTLTEADGTLVAESGEATISLHTLDASEWPRVSVAGGEPVELAPAAVADLRRIVMYAEHDPKQPNPFLQGVHFSGQQAEATDRYRFARVTLGVDVPEAVVPWTALERVLRNASGSVLFSADRTQATFASGNVEWTTRLIEGEYPTLDRFIRPSSPHSLTLGTARLAEAVQLTRIMTGSDDGEGIILSVDGGKAFLRNRDVEQGEITDVVPCDGSLPWPITLQGRYLADVIDNATDDEITFGFEGEMKPVQVDSDHLTQVVMPIRPQVKK